MSLILNIDTASDIASVCLAKDRMVLQTAINENQKDHAAWLHPAIEQLLQQNNLKPRQLDAVAVSIGPGSYTGLRIGLASAKGLCYVLNIPLITVGTLEMMANAVKEEATDLICPLVDARRMEVFTAVYDRSLEPRLLPHALVIDDTSFTSLLSANKILFCGNGSAKLKSVLKNPNARFSDTRTNAADLVPLSTQYFDNKGFADLAYTEPLYIKEFYSHGRNL